ncbi:MAG: hypothetical protein RBS80_20265 [Thermoguttaceae bacterium]|jgi:hypothetical protein|nr:hypothetical protein [Thermoguttaceae bacterium]
MDARIIRAAMVVAALVVTMGAQFRTPNFVVETQDPRLAREFALAAEQQRRELAVSWLGEAMPNWAQPCLITVRVGPQLGAGGATTFYFDQGEVFGWRMSIQGSRERILDSVLPHEITHMVLASHFRRPIPRWADEGAATSVEHVSEKNKHRRMLYQFLRTGRGIAFNQLFAMREYPADIMPLYAQSYSVAEYLIQIGGRRKYIEFVGDGMDSGDWCGAIGRHYGIDNSGALQQTWLAWVQKGCPNLRPASPPEAQPGVEVVAVSHQRERPEPNLIYHVPPDSPGYAPGSVVQIRDPARNPAPPAATPPNEPVRQIASADGWYAAGQRLPRAAEVAAAEPSPKGSCYPGPEESHLTKPQPAEPSRQIIIDWGGR